MQTQGVRPAAPQTTKGPRPPKADAFKQAMARAMEGAGPNATAAALRPRPAPNVATTVAPSPPAQPIPQEGVLRQRIAALESGTGPAAHTARNPTSGAIGRYQMLPIAFRDIGWMGADGTWTATAARHGVSTEAEFLDNPAAQEVAMDAYLRRTELQLDRNGSLLRAGTTVQGIDGRDVPLTEAGLVAAAHRRGAASVARYIAHRSGTPDAPPPPDQAVAFAQVERRLRDFATLPHAVAGRGATSRAG